MKEAKRKRDMSNTLPSTELRGSRKNPFPSGKREGPDMLNNNSSIDESQEQYTTLPV